MRMRSIASGRWNGARPIFLTSPPGWISSWRRSRGSQRIPVSGRLDLPPLDQILRGSLFERTTFHSSGGSKCATGVGHPQWFVTVTYPGGKTKQISLTAAQLPQVRQWIANYRLIKDALESVSEANLESLRRDRTALRAAAGAKP